MRNIAWVAGLFEGEGCISIFDDNRHSKAFRKVVAIRINLTDEDVLKDLKEVVGGKINGPYSYKTRPNVKPFWSWSITKDRDLYQFLCSIRPWMGARRKEKLDEALLELQKRKQIKQLFE